MSRFQAQFKKKPVASRVGGAAFWKKQRTAFVARRRAEDLDELPRMPRARQLPTHERKFFDTALSIPVDATAEVPATGGQLVLIPQGDTESTRDGRMASIKSIQIRAVGIFAPAAAATAATNTWLYVVLDKQANGAAAAVTDVFTSTGLHSALLNLNNSGRFVILKKFHHRWVAPAGVTTAYNNVVQHIDWFAKCDVPIDWSSTTGAITEIRSNNVFLIAGSDGQSDDLVTWTGNARVRFEG